MRQGRIDDALAYYDRVPDNGSPDSVIALYVSGDLLLHNGRLGEAEPFFRKVLAVDPLHTGANHRLALLLGFQGRRWESAPYLLELVRQNESSLQTLLLLGNLEQPSEPPDELRKRYEAHARDRVCLIGSALIDMRSGDFNSAERRLRRVIEEHPDQLEAHAQLGTILVDRSESEFFEWHQGLPPGADRHPQIWVARGLWAKRHDRLEVAARCFWEAVLRDPNRQVAHYQLGQSLSGLRRSLDAEPFLTRARQLDELAGALEQVYKGRTGVALLSEVSRQMESLGRPWEAWAWSQMALTDDPRHETARQRLADLHAGLQSQQLPQTLFTVDSVLAAELSGFPLPQWSRKEPSPAPHRSPGERHVEVSVAFEDRSAEAGLKFTYYNSADPSTEGMRMFEFTGGGVAVLDFDNDSWPDLHLTQGCIWPPEAEAEMESPTYRDCLYRNLGNGRFSDVTSLANVGDPAYSQGATVGDINSDGFEDLYVANIGTNRCFRNNGDGTFDDVTTETGTTGGDHWATSCVLADFNSDGFPDLYLVNYLTGALTRICQQDGISRACSPAGFEAEQDRVFLNLGTGQFEDQTDSSGIRLPDGKGLGVVVAAFEGGGSLDLFVANDATPNFYLRNRTPRASGRLEFENQALFNGLAFDQDGRSQACMGVAAGDANEDGSLDLFVTNFFRESNTLYLNQKRGQFLDATGPANLREPSYELLGFGTQFIDGDLDGRPDLVVANGDVDDFSHSGRLYHMPPQYFQNVGGGRFEELPAETLGPWFQQKYLGRGLARIDWNRDGRNDFVVSHLDSPSALVTNVSPRTGRFLAVRLRGTESSRDAIGTIVTAEAGDHTWTQQLTGGDGYQASNQRQLIFGLGEREKVDALTVRWPSGTEQVFHSLSADSELLLIEGRSAPVPILSARAPGSSDR